MNRDEIIAMAKEATQDHEVRWSESDAQTVAFFLRLAALVAARERERCANHIEDCEAPIAVHGARVEIGLTTRIAYANSIRALNTEGEGNDKQPASD